MHLESGKIVVLTGAGISAESGLATFRGSGGLWENHRLEDVATPEAFERDPELVHRFYNKRRRDLLAPAVRPNAAHLALRELEARFPETLLVTQNVDDLHERAGSRNVVHMHGKLLEIRCVRSGAVFAWTGDVFADTSCACCHKKGTLRPNIVWFGEQPMKLDRIFQALEACGLFVSIGTSGQVYPAAGFVEHVRRYADALTVELNLEASATGTLFTEKRTGPATEIVPEFVKELIENA